MNATKETSHAAKKLHKNIYLKHCVTFLCSICYNQQLYFVSKKFIQLE